MPKQPNVKNKAAKAVAVWDPNVVEVVLLQ